MASNNALTATVLEQNGQARSLCRRSARWRRVHLVAGLLVGLWLVMMAVTGVVINHQLSWGFDEVEVSNRFLPGHYTTEFLPETTRLSVLVADLHSGNFFWGQGKLISDLVALLVLLSVGSGVYSHLLRRKAFRVCQRACEVVCQDEGTTAPVLTPRRSETVPNLAALDPATLEEEEEDQALQRVAG